MEEIREAASAYYANLSEQDKQLATDFFKEMDANGDGNISIREFIEFVKRKGAADISNQQFFKLLDKDGNGTLNFDEAFVVYYVYRNGRVIVCAECREFLKGMYFTCVQCFSRPPAHTYDLCCDCYRGKKMEHHHDAVFLDNYSLLRAMRQVEVSAHSPAPAPAANGSTSSTTAQGLKINDKAFKILQTAAATASIGSLGIKVAEYTERHLTGTAEHSANTTDQGVESSAIPDADPGSASADFSIFDSCATM